VTPVSVGDGVACALTRLLRPEEVPLLAVLDAWPLTVPDVLGDSGPAGVVGSWTGGGLATALERLLRPDREVMLLAIYSLDLAGDELLPAPGPRDRPGEPPGSAPAP